MSQSTLSPPESLSEETGKPGTNWKQVKGADRKRINPIVRHYMKQAHPFTACVRDNTKRFGPDRAARICAVVKDMGKGTTKWRNQEEIAEALYEAAEGDIRGLEDMYRDAVAQRLDIVIEEIGEHATALLLMEDWLVESELSARTRKALPKGAFVFPGERRYPIHDLAHARNALARSAGKPEAAKVRAAVFAKFPQLKKGSSLREEVRRLADEYAAIPGEPTMLNLLIAFTDDPLYEFGLATFDESKHRRDRKGRFTDMMRKLSVGQVADVGRSGKVMKTAKGEFFLAGDHGAEKFDTPEEAGAAAEKIVSAEPGVAIADRARALEVDGGLKLGGKYGSMEIIKDPVGYRLASSRGVETFTDPDELGLTAANLMRQTPQQHRRNHLMRAILSRVQDDPEQAGLTGALRQHLGIEKGGYDPDRDGDYGNWAEAQLAMDEWISHLVDQEEERWSRSVEANFIEEAAAYDESKHKRGEKGTPEGGRFIRKGSSGPATRAVQRGVGAKEDGEFGPRTQARVKAFQKRRGLEVDGIVGKQTAAALLGNRQASKLNTGRMTESQRARLRDGGRSRKRRSQILREEEIVESVLGGLRRGARDYTRVGGGHGRKSGRFSKREIAAIGRKLVGDNEPPSRIKIDRSRKQYTRTRAHVRSPEAQKKIADRATAKQRERFSKPGARNAAAKRSGGADVKTLAGKGPKSAFAPGGRGEKIGADIEAAEKKVIAAVQASPAYKAALAEMKANGAVEKLAKIPMERIANEGTQVLYGGTPGMEHKLYSDATRQALHAEILKAFTQGTARGKDAGPADALFMAGGSAAGKSTILNSGQASEPESAALLNADAIKACLPEYDALRLNPNDEIAKKAAGAVHEESSDLNKRLMRYAQLAGSNYVVDGVGDNKPPKFVKQLDAAREAGANVRLTYATTFVEDAVGRAESRFEGKSRRYVDSDILYKAHKGASENFFGQDEQGKNGVIGTDYPFQIFDTSHDPPLLIAERKSGKGVKAVKIHDQAAYDKFAARGRGTRDAAPVSELRTPADIWRAVRAGRVKVSELSPAQRAMYEAEVKKRGGGKKKPSDDEKFARIAAQTARNTSNTRATQHR